MSNSGGQGLTATGVLLWIARLSGTAVAVFLLPFAFGESGSGPTAAESVYLALFPFGFSAGYLLGWRWPLLGGCVSLSGMALSLVVLGRLHDWDAYVTWSLLTVPAVLFVISGLKLRAAQARDR